MCPMLKVLLTFSYVTLSTNLLGRHYYFLIKRTLGFRLNNLPKATDNVLLPNWIQTKISINGKPRLLAMTLLSMLMAYLVGRIMPSPPQDTHILIPILFCHRSEG